MTPAQHIFPKRTDKTVITPLTPKPPAKMVEPTPLVEEDEADKSVRRNRLQRATVSKT